MRVIGTAGHVDHGKTTLVQRLTGINTDRLAEEQARQMTIDLGFAWLPLPDGDTIGIVDVPGHRDFIENMLAGVASIDAAVLVISADEGIMPQTREHLAILRLLGIPRCIIALTKIDIVADPDWIELVQEEIIEALEPTTFADSGIFPVSAHTGEGMAGFTQALVDLVADLGPRIDYDHPRLPVDRVFSISGFGTVVTGTLSGGSLSIGDLVELQPGGQKSRIRGLESYNASVSTALPGSRVAVNLTDLPRRAIQRGQVIARPGQLRPTLLFDARVDILPEAGRPLKHNDEIKCFSGASEAIGRVRVMDSESVAPGTSAWVQVRLNQPLPLTFRDRFIIRFPTPAETIGGGMVINTSPGKRWRRFDPAVIEDMAMRLQGTLEERLVRATGRPGGTQPEALIAALGVDQQQLDGAIAAAIEAGQLYRLPDQSLIAMDTVQSMLRSLVTTLGAYHAAHPLATGMPRESLRQTLNVSAPVYAMLLEQATGEVTHDRTIVKLASHQIAFNAHQRQRIDAWRAEVAAKRFTPPSTKEARSVLGDDVFEALVALGELVQVQPDVIFDRETYDELVAGVLVMIDEDGHVTPQSLRDAFGTTRKYTIGLLEYLDRIGITRRTGDVRVRGSAVR
jgi:selenocysteine-specific elongation factor